MSIHMFNFASHLQTCFFFFERILLRVKLLYFLRHEVIGKLGPKIKEGCNARFVIVSVVNRAFGDSVYLLILLYFGAFLMYQFGDNKYMVTWCKIHLLDGNLFRTTSKARLDLLLIKTALLWRLALLCHHTWWSLYHVTNCCKHL